MTEDNIQVIAQPNTTCTKTVAGEQTTVLCTTTIIQPCPPQHDYDLLWILLFFIAVLVITRYIKRK